jgi:hypothetical protein
MGYLEYHADTVCENVCQADFKEVFIKGMYGNINQVDVWGISTMLMYGNIGQLKVWEYQPSVCMGISTR